MKTKILIPVIVVGLLLVGGIVYLALSLNQQRQENQAMQELAEIDKREMVHHSALDIQKKHGKSIYGSGFLISYTAAERVTAERAAVKKEAIVWELSEREMRIVEKLSGQ